MKERQMIMSKHLIYLGVTQENKYRIALFDDENILAQKVPVKDVIKLTDETPFLNCTVKNGVPMPNLMGTRVLCVPSAGNPAKYIGDYVHRGKYAFYNDLVIDKKAKHNIYLYGESEKFGDRLEDKSSYKPSVLLGNVSKNASIWDGNCSEKQIYLIANLAVKINSKRYGIIGSSCVCMDALGHLFIACGSDLCEMHRNGFSFVQVGTPKLTYGEKYIKYKKEEEGLKPIVPICPEDTDKVLWRGKKIKADTILPKIEHVLTQTVSVVGAINDMRSLSNAKVFGMSSLHDCRAVIYPESTESIWLGVLKRCRSVKVIYIPENVKELIEYCVPKNKIKNIKFYSKSGKVKELCEKYGAEYVECADADSMLKEFYTADNEDYANVEDLSNIAALGGVQSNRHGEDGKVWTAALFSLSMQGIATDVLHEKYPVVDLCKGRYSVPISRLKYAPSTFCKCDWESGLGKERCRTFVGALEQFYSYCTKEPVVNDLSYEVFQLSEYSLYLSRYAFNEKLYSAYNRYLCFLESSLKAKRAVGYKEAAKYGLCVDKGASNHLCLIVDNAKKEVIHRFACSDSMLYVLCTFSGAGIDDVEPCAVLRYADKLPSMYTYNYRNDNQSKIMSAIFTSFLVFSYGFKGNMRNLFGIDLYTGCLCTMNYAQTMWRGFHSILSPTYFSSVNVRKVTHFADVISVRNIKLYGVDADLSEKFPKDCLYVKESSKK